MKHPQTVYIVEMPWKGRITPTNNDVHFVAQDFQLALCEREYRGDYAMTIFSKKKTKNSALIAAAGLLASVGVVAGTAGAANANLAPGTDGSGYVLVPSASPYISYAVVERCWATTATVAQAKTFLAGQVSYGPKSVNVLDGESKLMTRKEGTYTDGRWDCVADGDTRDV